MARHVGFLGQEGAYCAWQPARARVKRNSGAMEAGYALVRSANAPHLIRVRFHLDKLGVESSEVQYLERIIAEHRNVLRDLTLDTSFMNVNSTPAEAAKALQFVWDIQAKAVPVLDPAPGCQLLGLVPLGVAATLQTPVSLSATTPAAPTAAGAVKRPLTPNEVHSSPLLWFICGKGSTFAVRGVTSSACHLQIRHISTCRQHSNFL